MPASGSLGAPRSGPGRLALGGELSGGAGGLAALCFAGAPTSCRSRAADRRPLGRSPNAPAARAALLVDRRPGAVGAAAVGAARRTGARPRGARRTSRCWSSTGRPRSRPDPRVRPVRPDELDRYLPGGHRDVHRGGRRQPARRRRRRRLPRAGRRARRGRARVRPLRGRRGGVQGRDRALSPRGRARSRASGSRPAHRGRGTRHGRAPRPSVESRRRGIAPVVSLYVNDFNRAARPPTSASGSARSAASPRSCSDRPARLAAAGRDRRGSSRIGSAGCGREPRYDVAALALARARRRPWPGARQSSAPCGPPRRLPDFVTARCGGGADHRRRGHHRRCCSGRRPTRDALKPVSLKAESHQVREATDRAAASMTVTWDLGQHRTWSYLGELDLLKAARRRAGLAVRWAPTVVHPQLAARAVAGPADRGPRARARRRPQRGAAAGRHPGGQRAARPRKAAGNLPAVAGSLAKALGPIEPLITVAVHHRRRGPHPDGQASASPCCATPTTSRSRRPSTTCPGCGSRPARGCWRRRRVRRGFLGQVGLRPRESSTSPSRTAGPPRPVTSGLAGWGRAGTAHGPPGSPFGREQRRYTETAAADRPVAPSTGIAVAPRW